MARFSSPEQAAAIIDHIADLIPSHKMLHYNASEFVCIPGYESIEAMREFISRGNERLGSNHVNWQAQVAFNPTAPRTWEADIHEPYEINVGTEQRPTYRYFAKPTLPYGWDPRVSHARFGTSGLNIYHANQAYHEGQIDWDILEPALQTAGRLAIFAGNSFFTHSKRFTDAMVRTGHGAYDGDEQAALLDLGIKKFGPASAEETARRRSLRITEEGADYLLEVLLATKETQERLREAAATAVIPHLPFDPPS